MLPDLPSAAQLGVRMVDDVRGQVTSLTIPPERVVSATWLADAAQLIQQITLREPAVSVGPDGICFTLGYCTIPRRRQVMNTPLPAPVLLDGEQPLRPPQVMYVSKTERFGVLNADQPVSGRTLMSLETGLPSDRPGLRSKVELLPRSRRLVWQLHDNSELLGYDDLRALQQPVMAGTCSLEVWPHNAQTRLLQIVLSGPPDYSFSWEALRQIPGVTSISRTSGTSIEIIASCAWDRHSIWQLAEAIAWSQRLYPVGWRAGLVPIPPLIWHDEPGSRIMLDRPTRRCEWPLEAG